LSYGWRATLTPLSQAVVSSTKRAACALPTTAARVAPAIESRVLGPEMLCRRSAISRATSCFAHHGAQGDRRTGERRHVGAAAGLGNFVRARREEFLQADVVLRGYAGARRNPRSVWLRKSAARSARGSAHAARESRHSVYGFLRFATRDKQADASAPWI